MAIQKIQYCRIAGIAACVPRAVVDNQTSGLFSSNEEYEKFVANVGVVRRRKAHSPDLVASDMCAAAVERLLARLEWQPDEIDALIFVSQSQDYKLPATACILQDRLQLPKTCMAFDISMGCSGWGYGMGVAGALIHSGGFRKVLLLAAEDQLAIVDQVNKAEAPLFGAAGTCTALEYDETAAPITVETGTDGSGYSDIIVKDGGSRHPFTADSLVYHEDEHGNKRRSMGIAMNGANVFVFGITRAPRAVRSMLAITGETVESTDYFVLHQANKMMNEKIRVKCKIPVEKCPYSIDDFGNNSSASIPLTIVTELRERASTGPVKICTCGFGVGLSWSTLYTTLQKPLIPELIEI